jgi:hypothetical protein
MTHDDLEPLREILQRALTRYLAVMPTGFKLIGRAKPETSIEARILAFGGARTLYKNRKPDCRSLDGLQSITHPARTCAACELRSGCTPQVRLDVLVDGRPYRLLLAHTSARSFLAYEMKLRQKSRDYAQALHRIDVVDRGSWGELRFSTVDRGPSPT